MYRDRILDLHLDSERQIAREVRVSHTYVGKVIKRAQRRHFVKPKVDQTVSEYTVAFMDVKSDRDYFLMASSTQ